MPKQYEVIKKGLTIALNGVDWISLAEIQRCIQEEFGDIDPEHINIRVCGHSIAINNQGEVLDQLLSFDFGGIEGNRP